MTIYRKSGDHYLLASVLIAIIFSTITAAIVWAYETGLLPWLSTVSFGGEANSTNEGFQIIFNPVVTHNQSNDTITFKAKVVNVGNQPVDLSYAVDSFRIKVFDEEGSPIPDSEYSHSRILLLILRPGLNPGEGVDLSVEWRGNTYFIGAQRFTPGRYFVSGVFTGLPNSGYIESPRVEMVLSSNQRTNQLMNYGTICSIVAALLAFSVVILCAYLIRRFPRRIKPGNAYSYVGLQQ